MVAHLTDPAEFYRPHLFPSLAASEPAYDTDGNYWRGGVWAPTNYMAIKGLERIGEVELARRAAENHLANMAAVFAQPPTDSSSIAPEEHCDDCRTIWECYAPERASPGTRWDDRYLCRQEFVGWSGLGPIALLFESILGIEVRGSEASIVWTVTRVDRHGVERMPLGADNRVSLIAAARESADEPVHVTVLAEQPFGLTVRRPGREPHHLEVAAGEHTVTIP
jgi:hypothetical protein